MRASARRRFIRLSTIICLALCAVRDVLAQPALPPKAKADSAKTPAPLFTTRDFLVAGAFGVGTVAMFPFDERLAKHLTNPGAQANKFFKDASKGVEWIASPGPYLIGGTLYAVGRLGHYERVADLGWHGTEAVFVADVLTYMLKGINGRSRPYVSNDTNPRDFKFRRWLEAIVSFGPCDVGIRGGSSGDDRDGNVVAALEMGHRSVDVRWGDDGRTFPDVSQQALGV